MNRIMRYTARISVFSCFFTICGAAVVFCAGFPAVEIQKDDRVLIFAPHPDDEVICCAGIIQESLKKGASLRVVFLTYGDNNEWSFLVYRRHPVFFPGGAKAMGKTRHDEAIAAAKVLGVAGQDIIFLGYPDFGAINIWLKHWGDRPAGRGMLTRAVSVPYRSAFRQHAPHKGDEILRDIETIFSSFRPTKIFVSHPADHNTDHLACYLFTRVALWDLEHFIRPRVYPYLVHYRHWPEPKGVFPDQYLCAPPAFAGRILWESFELSPRMTETKDRALKEHRSQYISSPGYLSSFVRRNEIFGDFPSLALRRDEPGADIAAITAQDSGRKEPDEILAAERAAFVGIERRSVRLDGYDLVITCSLSRPLGRTVGLSLYVFGYRYDRPFARMPKLRLRFGMFSYTVYDQSRRLNGARIRVKRTPREIAIRIPLQTLGMPDHILTSANTYAGSVPLDWVSWRILDIVK